jgi:hypothetical protein
MHTPFVFLDTLVSKADLFHIKLLGSKGFFATSGNKNPLGNITNVCSKAPIV